MTQSTRRGWLMLCGTGLSVGLAGCSSDQTDDGSSSDEPSDRSDDESTDGNGENGEGDTGDGDSNGDADDETSDTGDGTDDTGDDTTNGDGETGAVLLSEILNWERSYVAEISFSGAQSGTMTQTVHGNDMHIVADFDGIQGESYSVDGKKYEIVGGQCLIRSDSEIEEQAPAVDDPSGTAPDIEATETTTIDGEPVYLFEMPSQEDARWYVSENTGYPVRFETEAFRVEFRSWGETEPISAPEMNCREV